MSTRQQVIHNTIELDMSTAATLAVVVAPTKIDTGREQGARIKQMKSALSWKDKPTTMGPLLAGFSVGLTNTQIAEALLADPVSDKTNVEASEQSNRRVFPVWLIPAGIAVASEELQELKEIHFPWKEIDEGTGLDFWVQNLDGSTLTGNTLVTTQIAFVTEWLRD